MVKDMNFVIKEIERMKKDLRFYYAHGGLDTFQNTIPGLEKKLNAFIKIKKDHGEVTK